MRVRWVVLCVWSVWVAACEGGSRGHDAGPLPVGPLASSAAASTGGVGGTGGGMPSGGAGGGMRAAVGDASVAQAGSGADTGAHDAIVTASRDASADARVPQDAGRSDVDANLPADDLCGSVVCRADYHCCETAPDSPPECRAKPCDHPRAPRDYELWGYWREVERMDCLGNWAASDASYAIGELSFCGPSDYVLTWTPFETYVDFIGTYTLMPGTGAVSFDIMGVNFEPSASDLTGTAIIDGDILTLQSVWFGSRWGEPEACGYRFVYAGSDPPVGC